MSKTFGSASGCSFYLKGEMDRCVIIRQFMGLWPVICLDGQGFGWTRLENWWWQNLGKRYLDRHLWMGKHMKKFVSHMNTQPRRILVSSGYEYSFGRYQSAFSSHSCHWTMASWRKWSWWQKWKLCIDSGTWTSTSKGWHGHSHH